MWTLYVTVITLHFIFDWVLQPRDIAKTKKTDSNSLIVHMLTNILPFTFIVSILLVFLFGYSPENAMGIMILNFLSHFLIDALLPSGRNEREMINWTAVDQILHINILIILLQS